MAEGTEQMTGKDNLHADTGFERKSWLVLGIAGAILALSILHLWYRTTLPSDGWRFPFEVSEGEQRLVFQENLTDRETPLQAGDILLAVEGQPFKTMVGRAIRLRPQRPSNWQVGQTARYTVMREGRELTLDVELGPRPLWEALPHIMRWAFLNNPDSLPQLLIALFVFWKRPRCQAARLLLLLAACQLASVGLSQPFSPFPGPAEMFSVGAYWPSFLFGILLWPFFIVPTLAYLFLVFPVPKPFVHRHPKMAVAAVYGLSPLIMVTGVLTRFDQPLTFWRTPFELGGGLVVPLVLAVIVISVVHTFLTERNPVARAQTRWLALGVLLTHGVGGLLFFLPNLGVIELTPLIATLYGIVSLALPASLAIAILRFRLFDIDIIIRRTLQYGLLTGLLALIYFGAVILLQRFLRSLTGQADSPLVVVISTLGIAAIFNPLRLRIQEFIDRRFYRAKYDAEQALAQFTATARDETDIEQLTNTLLGVVEETMQPEQLSLWLKPIEEKSE